MEKYNFGKIINFCEYKSKKGRRIKKIYKKFITKIYTLNLNCAESCRYLVLRKDLLDLFYLLHF